MIIQTTTERIEEMVREAFKAGTVRLIDSIAEEKIADINGWSVGDEEAASDYAIAAVRRLLAEQPRKIGRDERTTGFLCEHSKDGDCELCPPMCDFCYAEMHSQCVGPGCACFKAGRVNAPDGLPILHPIRTKVAKLGGGFHEPEGD